MVALTGLIGVKKSRHDVVGRDEVNSIKIYSIQLYLEISLQLLFNITCQKHKNTNIDFEHKEHNRTQFKHTYDLIYYSKRSILHSYRI